MTSYFMKNTRDKWLQYIITITPSLKNTTKQYSSEGQARLTTNFHFICMRYEVELGEVGMFTHGSIVPSLCDGDVECIYIPTVP